MVELKEFVKNQYEIRDTLYELKQNFMENFDRGWFYLVIDDLPIDLKNIKEIKEAFMESGFYVKLNELFKVILKLEYFIQNVRKYLAPVIKEKLRVSHLHPNRIVTDKNLYIKHNLIAYVFPYNLEQLNKLTVKLKAYLTDSLSN